MIHRIRLLLLLSAAFIALAAHNAFAAQGEIIVAKSGGQFTSIQAAIDSVTPSASNPYVIKVMPGTYDEQITMKSYTHLQGAGRDITSIRAWNNATILINSLTNVSVTGFAIKGGYWAIKVVSSSPLIKENYIYGTGGTGIWCSASASPTIENNLITGNTSGGIANDYSSSIIRNNTIINNGQIWDNATGINEYYSNSVITGNTITGNSGSGISIWYSSPSINGNTITGNGWPGYNYAGISIHMTSSPVVTGSRITGNGGSYGHDIGVWGGATPNISSNIYDTITGSTGVGLYNVKSNGDPAPAP
ncbi:MAG: pectinesterase family protein [Nitrospirota bacterium]|nr:pectinesterase family protein [Nitrospirota bacterium]